MTDSTKLFTALSLVDRELVSEAETYRPKRAGRALRWAALAACLGILLIPLSYLALTHGGDSPAKPPSTPSDPSYPVPDSGVSSYDGPILPLTVSGGDGITAERHITLELSKILSSGDVGLTDSYILTNNADSDVTLTVRYPFVGSFAEPRLPTLTVDGEPADAALRSGPYVGGFSTLDYHILREPSTPAQYADVLADGSYLSAALEDIPEISIPVTVYELRGIDFDRSLRYAALKAEFTRDEDKTLVFLWGFNDDAFSVESGRNSYSFGSTVPDDKVRYIVAVGDDIGGLTVKGYGDARCDENDRVDATTDILRYETTMGKLLDALSQGFAQNTLGDDLPRHPDPSVDTDLFIREVWRNFSLYSRLGSEPSVRYEPEQLERLLNDTLNEHRVMYMELELTVPAGGSVTVEVKQEKPAATCSSLALGFGKRCDIALTLGSGLTFTSQSVTFTGEEGLDIRDETSALPNSAGDVRSVTVYE